MKKTIAALILLLFISYGLFLNPHEAPAADTFKVTASILDSAESFFISLKKRNYGAVWDSLSAKSQRTIIDNVFKASKKAGEDLKKSFIKNDFKEKGTLFITYWDALLTEFDPDMVLEESRWEMGRIDSNSAEIIILHKKSERPAILQMFRENGVWKVGFRESFDTGRF